MSYQNLNGTQLKALAIIPHITGSISVIASSYVLQDIIRDPKKRRRTYCRLVFGMAAIDFITSLMYTLCTLPMEMGSGYGVFALGNAATCTTQAFLIQMEIASPIYHFYLAWYYLLILKYRWPERKFGEYETKLHAFALLFALGTSIGLLPANVYGEFFVWCWITNVEGNGYYQWFFFFGPLWFIIFASSIIMAQMYFHVQAEETVSRKWRNSTVDTSKLGEKKLRKMTDRVFWQAVHYELAFYATWTIPTLSQTIFQLGNIKPAFGMQLVNAFFTPLAGFFNFTIYIRPRYVKYMEENKKQMWWYVMWKATKTAVPSRKMKVEIVSVDMEDFDEDEDNDGATNRVEDDSTTIQQSDSRREDSKIQDYSEHEKALAKKIVEQYGYEDPDESAAAKKYGYEDPDNSNNYGNDDPDASKYQFASSTSMDIEDDDSDDSFIGERDEKSSAAATAVYRQHPLKRQKRSKAICILDYEEDDVGVMDPGAALEQLYEVDEKLKKMSLPKKGRRKVYKLVQKINNGVKKRRRSLTGSVRSLLGMDEPPSDTNRFASSRRYSNEDSSKRSDTNRFASSRRYSNEDSSRRSTNEGGLRRYSNDGRRT